MCIYVHKWARVLTHEHPVRKREYMTEQLGMCVRQTWEDWCSCCPPKNISLFPIKSSLTSRYSLSPFLSLEIIFISSLHQSTPKLCRYFQFRLFCCRFICFFFCGGIFTSPFPCSWTLWLWIIYSVSWTRGPDQLIRFINRTEEEFFHETVWKFNSLTQWCSHSSYWVLSFLEGKIINE